MQVGKLSWLVRLQVPATSHFCPAGNLFSAGEVFSLIPPSMVGQIKFKVVSTAVISPSESVSPSALKLKVFSFSVGDSGGIKIGALYTLQWIQIDFMVSRPFQFYLSSEANQESTQSIVLPILHFVACRIELPCILTYAHISACSFLVISWGEARNCMWCWQFVIRIWRCVYVVRCCPLRNPFHSFFNSCSKHPWIFTQCTCVSQHERKIECLQSLDLIL